MTHKVFPHEPHIKQIGDFILGYEGRGSGPVDDENSIDLIACSNCFVNEGLRLDAYAGGIAANSMCPRCCSQTSRKLTRALLETLAHRFFVRGTFQRCEYGAAPIIQFNDRRPTDIEIPTWLDADIHLFEELVG